MNENKFSIFKDKKVFIILKSGIIYNGVVKETTENFIFIKDKFEQPVSINIEDIKTCEGRE